MAYAYIIPEAWNYYDKTMHTWSGWYTDMSSVKMYPKTDYVTGTESRLCVRFRVDKNVVRKVHYFTGIIEKRTPYDAQIAFLGYTFDPTPYGESVPSGYIANTTTTTTSDKCGFMFIGLDGSFLESTSEYFYALFWNESTSGVITRLMPFSLTYDEALVVVADYFDPTLSCSPTTVTTGSSFTAAVEKRAGRSCRILVKYGNTQLTTIPASDTNSIQTDKSWFTTAGVTTQKSITLSVQLQLYESGSYVTKSTQSITLNAGDDMRPVIGTATCSIVQPAPLSTNYPSTWVYNISKAKFAVEVTPGSNAAISSVVAKGSSGASVTLTYNSSTGKYEGTSGALTTNYWQIEVTDQRGMKKTSSNIGPSTIYGYVAPAVTIDTNNTYRCTVAGVKDANGTYFKAKANATIYQLPNNSIDILAVNGVQITPDAQSAVISSGGTAGDAIKLTFTATDRAGYSGAATITLNPGSSNIIIYTRKDSSGEETRIGIGKVPKRTWQSEKTDNLIDISIPSDSQKWNYGYFINEIPAGAFRAIVESNAGASFNKNFIDVDLTNNKAEKNAAAYFYKLKTDTNWTNLPSEIGSDGFWAGFRIVYNAMSHYSAMIVIIEMMPVEGRLWFRRVGEGYAGNWKSLTPT